jgi:putative membrane protein|tara:strand:- start:534 stop:791 length:258 start_codon:yes stop_codon:yes gene_type:complete
MYNFADFDNGYYHMMDASIYGWWGLLMIFFWIAVIIAVIVLVMRTLNSNGNADKSDDALDILKKRYAKGDITKKQFDEIKKDIKK